VIKPPVASNELAPLPQHADLVEGDELDLPASKREEDEHEKPLQSDVSTVKKSQASVVPARWRRNARQVNVALRPTAGPS
jgi:hypothetical protein